MMPWEQDFTPTAQQVAPVQNWQQDFTPANQNAPQQDNNLLGTKDQWARQAGLTTRDALDITSGSVASGADLLSSGLNTLTGMNALPTNTRDLYDKGLDVWGLPKPESTSEKIGSGATQIGGGLALGGEGTYNLLKQGYTNLGEMLSRSAPEATAEDASLIIPKNSDIKLIKQKLEMAGITPQQYADALKNSSTNDFAGELGGDPLRMQTQAQAKITGPSMQDARDAMRQRLAEAPQRTQQIIEQTFFPSSAVQPTVGGDAALAKAPLQTMEPVEQAQQNLVDIQAKLPDLYKAADATSVPRRASLGVINTPAGQQAMKDTVQTFANQGISPEQAGIIVDPENGFHGLQTQVPVSTLKELQQNLGNQVKRNPMTGAIEDHPSQVIEGMRQHITKYLSENSPEFAAANSNAAANFQGTNAFEMGRKLAHSAAGENADALMQRASNTFSPQELSLFKTGYAQGLSDSTMGTAIGGGSPASRIAKNTVTQTASDIIGPTQAQKFADALMQEKNRVDLAQRGLYGSNTAETLDAGLPKVPNIMELPSHAVNAAKDWLMQSRNERMGQLLYATSPEQKALLAQKVLEK